MQGCHDLGVFDKVVSFLRFGTTDARGGDRRRFPVEGVMLACWQI